MHVPKWTRGRTGLTGLGFLFLFGFVWFFTSTDQISREKTKQWTLFYAWASVPPVTHYAKNEKNRAKDTFFANEKRQTSLVKVRNMQAMEAPREASAAFGVLCNKCPQEGDIWRLCTKFLFWKRDVKVGLEKWDTSLTSEHRGKGSERDQPRRI